MRGLRGLLTRDPFEREVADVRAQSDRLAAHHAAQMGVAGAWGDVPLVERLASEPPQAQRAAVLLAQRTLGRLGDGWQPSGAKALTTAWTRKRVPWTPAEVADMLDAALSSPGVWLADVVRLPLAAAERLATQERVPLRSRLQALARLLEHPPEHTYDAPADRIRLLRRVGALLDDEQDVPRLPPDLLGGGDAWRSLLPAEVQEAVAQGPLVPLLVHAAAVTGVRPTASWSRRTAVLLGAAPQALPLVRSMLEVLARLPAPEGQRHGAWLTEPDEVLARGLVWVVATDPSVETTRLLGALALHAGLDPAGGGVVRMPKVAASVVEALARRDDAEAVAGLARLRTKVRYKVLVKTVDAALDALAERRGLARDELLELVVPEHGLDADGAHVVEAGAYRLRVVVQPPGEATLQVLGTAGTALRSVPAAVKEHSAAELAACRALQKEVRATLATERPRVEALLAADRTWTAARWQALYRDHPVTRAVSEHLLWRVEGADGRRTGLAVGAELVDLDGRPVALDAQDEVRLWHPMEAGLAEVRAWRERLTAREVRQPFPQAFRQVYLLTPAEEGTATYSNRFAAHVLQYRVFGGLLRARGWQAGHLGLWDGGDEGEGRRSLTPDWRVAFSYALVHPADGQQEAELCSTDQVRFERRNGTGAWDLAPLVEVPPRVLSEGMRDVDLFVGVASVAADPTWTDRGHERRYDEYWRQTAFGEVTESAVARREALRALMPRTGIADRVEVQDRFLVVRGDLRTYKIHLGSGNVLMEPDDSYLCIVPGASTDRLFLPFEEGGGRLSVIVSKAFLLADDSRISDRSIRDQIGAG